MAKNRVHETGDYLRDVAATDPATPASGDPIVVGQLPGVALVNEFADGTAAIQTNGIFTLSVKGIDGGGNSAVAVGDLIYYVTADTPKLSKKATGVRFGYALDTVGSGLTATIRVKVGY